MADIVAWFTSNSGTIAMVLGVIVAIDNALAQIPVVESNSTFQLVSCWIKSIYSWVKPTPPPQA